MVRRCRLRDWLLGSNTAPRTKLVADGQDGVARQASAAGTDRWVSHGVNREGRIGVRNRRRSIVGSQYPVSPSISPTSQATDTGVC